jgi:hypothetical protein
MSEEQKRGNREIRKPKQEKAAPKPDHLFASQNRRAANTNAAARQGQDPTAGSICAAEDSAMKIVIEFYRVREADDAHAVVGRETVVAANLDDAIEIARQLSQTLDMPQRPDAMSISDGDGNELYLDRLDCAQDERPLP